MVLLTSNSDTQNCISSHCSPLPCSGTYFVNAICRISKVLLIRRTFRKSKQTKTRGFFFCLSLSFFLDRTKCLGILWDLMVLKTGENKIVCIVLHRSLKYNLYKLHYFSWPKFSFSCPTSNLKNWKRGLEIDDAIVIFV